MNSLQSNRICVVITPIKLDDRKKFLARNTINHKVLQPSKFVVVTQPENTLKTWKKRENHSELAVNNKNWVKLSLARATMQIALSSRRRKFDKIFAVIFYARQLVEADRIPSTVRNSIFHPAFPHAACHAQKERGRKKMLKASEKGTSGWSTPKGCLENQLFIPVNSKQAVEDDNDLAKELPRVAHRMPLSGLDCVHIWPWNFSHFHIFHSRPVEKNFWREATKTTTRKWIFLSVDVFFSHISREWEQRTREKVRKSIRKMQKKEKCLLDYREPAMWGENVKHVNIHRE